MGGNQNLIRINLNDQSVNVLHPDNDYPLIDGLIFNEDRTILYGVSNLYGGAFKNTVSAYSSNDNWETADLLHIFRVNCPNTDQSPATATFRGDAIFVICVNGFGSGPYEVRYNLDVSDKVTDGNDIYSISSNDDDEDDEDEQDFAVAFYVTLAFAILFCLIATIVGYFLFKSKPDDSLIAHHKSSEMASRS